MPGSNTGSGIGVAAGSVIGGPVGGAIGGFVGGLFGGTDFPARRRRAYTHLAQYAKDRISEAEFVGGLSSSDDGEWQATGSNGDFTSRGSYAGPMTGTAEETLRWATDRSVWQGVNDPNAVTMAMRITQAFYDYKYGGLGPQGAQAGSSGGSGELGGTYSGGGVQTGTVIPQGGAKNYTPYMIAGGVVIAIVLIIVIMKL